MAKLFVFDTEHRFDLEQPIGTSIRSARKGLGFEKVNMPIYALASSKVNLCHHFIEENRTLEDGDIVFMHNKDLNNGCTFGNATLEANPISNLLCKPGIKVFLFSGGGLERIPSNHTGWVRGIRPRIQDITDEMWKSILLWAVSSSNDAGMPPEVRQLLTRPFFPGLEKSLEDLFEKLRNGEKTEDIIKERDNYFNSDEYLNSQMTSQ